MIDEGPILQLQQSEDEEYKDIEEREVIPLSQWQVFKEHEFETKRQQVNHIAAIEEEVEEMTDTQQLSSFVPLSQVIAEERRRLENVDSAE